MVGDGRLAAVLEFPAGHLCSLCSGHLPKQERRVDAVRRRGDGWRANLLSHAEQLRGEPVQGPGRARCGRGYEFCCASRWQRFEPPLAIPRNGDSSAAPPLRLDRFYHSFSFSIWCASARLSVLTL